MTHSFEQATYSRAISLCHLADAIRLVDPQVRYRYPRAHILSHCVGTICTFAVSSHQRASEQIEQAVSVASPPAFQPTGSGVKG
jgi:hypothetical protein